MSVMTVMTGTPLGRIQILKVLFPSPFDFVPDRMLTTICSMKPLIIMCVSKGICIMVQNSASLNSVGILYQRILTSQRWYCLQTGKSSSHCRGIAHALRSVLHEADPRALYKGWFPSIMCKNDAAALSLKRAFASKKVLAEIMLYVLSMKFS